MGDGAGDGYREAKAERAKRARIEHAHKAAAECEAWPEAKRVAGFSQPRKNDQKLLFDPADPPEHVTLHNYPVTFAGVRAVIPEYKLDVMPDGTLGVSATTLAAIHRSIGSEILSKDEFPSWDELEFLLDTLDIWQETKTFLTEKFNARRS